MVSNTFIIGITTFIILAIIIALMLSSLSLFVSSTIIDDCTPKSNKTYSGTNIDRIITTKNDELSQSIKSYIDTKLNEFRKEQTAYVQFNLRTRSPAIEPTSIPELRESNFLSSLATREDPVVVDQLWETYKDDIIDGIFTKITTDETYTGAIADDIWTKKEENIISLLASNETLTEKLSESLSTNLSNILATSENLINLLKSNQEFVSAVANGVDVVEVGNEIWTSGKEEILDSLQLNENFISSVADNVDISTVAGQIWNINNNSIMNNLRDNSDLVGNVATELSGRISFLNALIERPNLANNIWNYNGSGIVSSLAQSEEFLDNLASNVRITNNIWDKHKDDILDNLSKSQDIVENLGRELQENRTFLQKLNQDSELAIEVWNRNRQQISDTISGLLSNNINFIDGIANSQFLMTNLINNGDIIVNNIANALDENPRLIKNVADEILNTETLVNQLLSSQLFDAMIITTIRSSGTLDSLISEYFGNGDNMVNKITVNNIDIIGTAKINIADIKTSTLGSCDITTMSVKNKLLGTLNVENIVADRCDVNVNQREEGGVMNNIRIINSTLTNSSFVGGLVNTLSINTCNIETANISGSLNVLGKVSNIAIADASIDTIRTSNIQPIEDEGNVSIQGMNDLSVDTVRTSNILSLDLDNPLITTSPISTAFIRTQQIENEDFGVVIKDITSLNPYMNTEINITGGINLDTATIKNITGVEVINSSSTNSIEINNVKSIVGAVDENGEMALDISNTGKLNGYIVPPFEADGAF